MRMYAYKSTNGQWFKGMSSDGHPLLTTDVTSAAFFSEGLLVNMGECVDSNFELYSFELSEPTLVKHGL